MNKPLILIVFSLLITSCSSEKYNFWDVSKFKMSEDALKDSEKVKLLYTSQGPDNTNDNSDYYIQLVVVSQETGDTVNVLTTINNGLTKEDGEKVYHFFSVNSMVYKVTQIEPDALIKTTPKDIENVQPKERTKVARDPEFDYIADNDFPTVKGMIALIDMGIKE